MDPTVTHSLDARAVPRRPRRVGPLRRAGRHADGRHGDRRRWPTGRRAATTPTPAARSPPPTPATRCSSGPGAASPSCSARRPAAIVFGANMTTLTLAFTRAVARDAAPRRPGRRHPPRPRRQRHAVAPRLRARPAPSTCSPRSTRRPGALDPAGGDRPDRRAHRAGSPSPAPPTCSARSPTSRRSSPPPTTPAPACSSTPCTSPRTAAIDVAAHRLRRPRHQPVQVVRPARRRAVRRPGAARRAAGRQGPPGRRPRPAPLGDGHAELRGHRRRRRRGRASCSTSGSTRIGRRRGRRVRPAARRAARRSTGVTRVGSADDGRPHADGRLHRRRPPPRRRRRRRSPPSASPRGPATPTPSRPSTSSASPTRGGVVRAGVVAYVDDDDVAAPAARRSSSRSSSDAAARERIVPLPDGGVDALEHVGVERGDDVEGAEVLDDLARPAGAGDHGRHVRVRRAPGQRQLGERAAELVGDRAQPLDLGQRPARRTGAWPASRSPASAPRESSGMPSRYLPVSSPDASGLQIVAP